MAHGLKDDYQTLFIAVCCKTNMFAGLIIELQLKTFFSNLVALRYEFHIQHTQHTPNCRCDVVRLDNGLDGNLSPI